MTTIEDTLASTPQEADAYIKRDMVKWARLIKEANLRID